MNSLCGSAGGGSLGLFGFELSCTLSGFSVSGTAGAAFSCSRSCGMVVYVRVQPYGMTIVCKGGRGIEQKYGGDQSAINLERRSGGLQ